MSLINTSTKCTSCQMNNHQAHLGNYQFCFFSEDWQIFSWSVNNTPVFDNSLFQTCVLRPWGNWKYARLWFHEDSYAMQMSGTVCCLHAVPRHKFNLWKPVFNFHCPTILHTERAHNIWHRYKNKCDVFMLCIQT